MLKKKPRRRFLFDLFTAAFFSGVFGAAFCQLNSHTSDWKYTWMFLFGASSVIGMIWIEIVIPVIDMVSPAKTAYKKVLRNWWLTCTFFPIPLSLTGPICGHFLMSHLSTPGWENRVALPSLIGILFWEIRLYRQYKKLREQANIDPVVEIFS